MHPSPSAGTCGPFLPSLRFVTAISMPLLVRSIARKPRFSCDTLCFAPHPLREQPFLALPRRQARVHRVHVANAVRLYVLEHESFTDAAAELEANARKVRFAALEVVVQVHETRLDALPFLPHLLGEIRK